MFNRNEYFVFAFFLSQLCSAANVDQSDGLRSIYSRFLDVIYDPAGMSYQKESWSNEASSGDPSLTSNHEAAKTQSATLRRVRRQERLLCLGNEFITTFFGRIIDANRQNLKDWEPINMGDAANIGIMDLKRGKAYGVANVFLQGEINVDCQIDPQYVSLEIPVGIRDIRIVYDYKMPLALYMIGGQAEIGFSLLGVNVTLYIAKNRRAGLKPYVRRVVVWSSRGFNMNLNGAGPATAALGLVFNLLAKVSPMVIEQFMSSLFLMVGGKLLANANLPL